jgi:glycosyltransferase involved in cell wall biosynthesis
MKFLFLCKRYPQGRDLLSRPYGRFFNLPFELSRKGHESYVLLLNYRNEPSLRTENKGVVLRSESIRPLDPFRYYDLACALSNSIQPDWVVGFSDTYFGIMAERLGRKFGIKSCIDAYDNFESYMPYFKPLHLLWRRALSKATMVTAAGPQLAELLQTSRPGKPVCIVPMSADPEFKPIDRTESRNILNLPLDKKIVGYSGSIYRNRGIEIVFHAFENACLKEQDVMLILTGRKQKGIHFPSNAKWLGYIDDKKLPMLLNSMDVLLAVNKLSSFGTFSYPAKLYEAMSCHIPVVATATEPARWILNDRRQFLALPEDSQELSKRICDLLPMGRYDYGILPGWSTSSCAFENALIAS